MTDSKQYCRHGVELGVVCQDCGDPADEPRDLSLGELIDALRAELSSRGDRVIPNGFLHAHSYRGYYDELAFEPANKVALSEMLLAAQSAMGRTFMGYKGGDYIMSEHTRVWLANYGSTGETLGSTLLRYMLTSQREATASQWPTPNPDSTFAPSLLERDNVELHAALATAVRRIKAMNKWFGVGPNPAIAELLQYSDLLAVLDKTSRPVG